MKILKVVPDGWKCKVKELSPGFFVDGEELCFKHTYGRDESLFNSDGKFYCGDEDRMVQPVVMEWSEEED